MQNPVQPGPRHVIVNLAAIATVFASVMTPSPASAALLLTSAILFALQIHYRPACRWFAAAMTVWAVEELHQSWILLGLGTALCIAGAIQEIRDMRNNGNGGGGGEARPTREAQRQHARSQRGADTGAGKTPLPRPPAPRPSEGRA